MRRARATIEEMAGKRDREMIVSTEIPYQVNKAELLKKVADLVRDKRLEGISDIRDESDRAGMRVVIELKRDAHGEIVLNKLYQMTALQSTFGYNCLAIVGQRPEVLDLRSALLRFIDHRREVVVRRTRYALRQAIAQREPLPAQFLGRKGGGQHGEVLGRAAKPAVELVADVHELLGQALGDRVVRLADDQLERLRRSVAAAAPR